MSEYDEDLNNEAKEIVDDNFNVDKEIIDILKDMLNSKNLELKTEIPKKEFEKIYRLAILKSGCCNFKRLCAYILFSII